jgi:hypothetical protein
VEKIKEEEGEIRVKGRQGKEQAEGGEGKGKRDGRVRGRFSMKKAEE